LRRFNILFSDNRMKILYTKHMTHVAQNWCPEKYQYKVLKLISHAWR